MIWLFTDTHLSELSNDKDNLSNKVWFHSSSFSKWCVLSNCCRHEKVLTVKRNQIWHWSHIYSYSIVPAHFGTHTRTKITELNINILKSFNVLIQRNKQCWFIYHHKMLRQKKFTFFHVCDACLFPLVMVVSLNKVSHTSVSRAERFVTLKTGAILHSVSLAVHHFTSTSCVSPFGNVKNINWPTGWIGWTWQALMVLFRLFGSVFFVKKFLCLKLPLEWG